MEEKLYTQVEVDGLLAIVKESLDEAKGDYVRLYAEFENYKKRVLREKEELVNSVKTRMLESILDIDSDLSLVKHNTDGVSLIMSKLEKFLKSQGVETIQTDVYDADMHEVISIADSNDISVVSKGYKMGDKVIRYPKIVLPSKHAV